MKKRLKKLFIPHEENGFRPDFLERFSMGVMMVLVLLSFTMANLQALFWVGSEWMVTAVLPSVIVNLTNEEREDDRIGTLTRNPTLDLAAQLKAEDMAEKSYFAHYAPDGTSPWYWFQEAGYTFTKAGENLAVHFNDSGKVVDAWMDSPSHRANILNGDYTEIGVGTARGEYKGSPTVFVVQLFGTPASTPAQTNTLVTNIETSSTSSTPQLAFAGDTDDILGEETPAPTPVEENPEPGNEPPASEPETVPVVEEPQPAVPDDEVATSLLETNQDGVVPATVGGDGGTPPARETFSLIGSFTQPSIWLQMVYAVLALVVAIALIMSIVIEWRRQHPVQIAYAGGLLAVMATLFYVHTTLTSGVIII